MGNTGLYDFGWNPLYRKLFEKHAGFVINRGGATTKDIIDLLNYVKDKVYENSGVTLEPEIRVIK